MLGSSSSGEVELVLWHASVQAYKIILLYANVCNRIVAELLSCRYQFVSTLRFGSVAATHALAAFLLRMSFRRDE